MINPSNLILFRKSRTVHCWLFNPLSKKIHFNEKFFTIAKMIGNWRVARNKARKLRVNSLAGCRLIYLQFAGEFTRGVIADCLQLRVFLPAIVRVLLPAFRVIFDCVWRVFLPAILVFLPANCMYFCLKKQAILHASRGQIFTRSACKITCKIPVVFR